MQNSTRMDPRLEPWSGLLGRPRALLAFAPLDAAVLARFTGAEVTVLDANEGIADARGEFDLVLFDGTRHAPATTEALVRRAASQVAPEGRLVTRLARTDASHRTLLTALGLEVLSPEPRRTELTVARRAPRPGPLTLTVGMLTMDEGTSIAWMIDAIARYAPDARVLCVDSSTRDDTPVIAERLGARVIRQLPPRGHGPAMEQLMYAAAGTSDALIYLDCDRTYPVDVLPRLRELLESGIDVVNTSRVRRRPAAMPLANYLANRVFAQSARVLAGTGTTDVHSGMRAYRSSVIRAFAFDGEGDALPIDTLLQPARRGYRVVEVPIPYSEREGTSKLRKVSGTVWTYVRLSRTLRVGSRADARYEVWDT